MSTKFRIHAMVYSVLLVFNSGVPWSVGSEPEDCIDEDGKPCVYGLDWVGRAVILKEDVIRQVNGVVYFTQAGSTTDFTYEFDEDIGVRKYKLPAGYGVTRDPDDPPNSDGTTALSETFTSYSEVYKYFGLDFSVGKSDDDWKFWSRSPEFSIDFNVHTERRSETESYYSVVKVFIDYWKLYVNPDAQPTRNPSINFPVPFNPVHVGKYEKYFKKNGTHYIKTAWVGGEFMSVYKTDKTGDMTEDDVKAAVKAAAAGFYTDLDGTRRKKVDHLRSNSKETITGKGGDDGARARLINYGEDGYDQWVKTVPKQPAAVEFEAEGIWSLIKDEAAALALETAYGYWYEGPMPQREAELTYKLNQNYAIVQAWKGARDKDVKIIGQVSENQHDWYDIASATGTERSSITFLVPPNHYYRITVSNEIRDKIHSKPQLNRSNPHEL